MPASQSKLPWLLSIDPGEGGKTGGTGWARFDVHGDLIDYGQFKTPEFNAMATKLITPDLSKVIIENYKNHAWARQKNWSVNQTSKHIGKLEMLCELAGVTYELVPNTNKPMGYMYMGMTPPGNHSISHQYDAMAHGVFWLQSNGITKPGKYMPDD